MMIKRNGPNCVSFSVFLRHKQKSNRVTVAAAAAATNDDETHQNVQWRLSLCSHLFHSRTRRRRRRSMKKKKKNTISFAQRTIENNNEKEISTKHKVILCIVSAAASTHRVLYAQRVLHYTHNSVRFYKSAKRELHDESERHCEYTRRHAYIHNVPYVIYTRL